MGRYNTREKIRESSPATNVLIHEKSSLAPPGETMAFKLGDEEGFRWVGAYEISADELLDEKAKEQGISGRTMRDVRSRMKNELEYRENEKQENSIRLKE